MSCSKTWEKDCSSLSGGKKSKRSSKKASKKGSKRSSRQKGGRGLPESLKVRQTFVKFIKDDLKLEGVSVGVIQKFVNLYTNQVKAKKPDIDNISIYAEAKKIYQADGKESKMDKLKKLGYGVSRSKKGGAKHSSKRSSKKSSKRSSKRSSK